MSEPLVRRLSEERALDVFRQVLAGLDYVHSHNVVHGDLKPENMLLSVRGVVKLADFGSSRSVGRYFVSTNLAHRCLCRTGLEHKAQRSINPPLLETSNRCVGVEVEPALFQQPSR